MKLGRKLLLGIIALGALSVVAMMHKKKKMCKRRGFNFSSVMVA